MLGSTLQSSSKSIMAHTGPTTSIDNVGARFIEAEKLDINRVFKVIDTDNSGYIDSDELKQVLKDLGFEKNALAACDRVFDNLGTGAEKISADSFYQIMSKKLDKNSSEEEIERNFKLFLETVPPPRKKLEPSEKRKPDDQPPQPVITPEVLQAVARNLGETISEEVAKQMIEEFNTEVKDGKKTGTISLEEFKKIMQSDLPDGTSPNSPKNANNF